MAIWWKKISPPNTVCNVTIVVTGVSMFACLYIHCIQTNVYMRDISYKFLIEYILIGFSKWKFNSSKMGKVMSIIIRNFQPGRNKKK